MASLEGSIQLLTKTKAELLAFTEPLLAGQKAVESDTNRSKTGDGITMYSDLRYDQAPRVVSITSSATPTLNADTTDDYEITALAISTTIKNPTGTPFDGQIILYRIKDNGTPRSISYDTAFVDLTGSAPNTTTTSKVTLVCARYSSSRGKWEIFANITEG